MWVVLLSSKPVGSRIQIEDGDVIVRPSIVDIQFVVLKDGFKMI